MKTLSAGFGITEYAIYLTPPFRDTSHIWQEGGLMCQAEALRHAKAIRKMRWYKKVEVKRAKQILKIFLLQAL